jgi:hypothetical protein
VEEEKERQKISNKSKKEGDQTFTTPQSTLPSLQYHSLMEYKT